MRAWLALAVLAAQEPPARPPDLIGRVAAAIADGSTVLVTLRTTGGTLKNRPGEFLFYVAPETKAVYLELPREERAPAAGLLAHVWLREGAGDRAAFVRFARDEKSLPPPPPPPPPPPLVLEAEEMDLRDVGARELAGAGGGKAIYFDRPGSRAKTTVKLRKGVWEIQVVLRGRKATRECLILRLAGREFRLTPGEADKLAVGRPRDGTRVAVDIPRDEDYELRLEFAETGIYVDRVILRPAP